MIEINLRNTDDKANKSIVVIEYIYLITDLFKLTQVFRAQTTDRKYVHVEILNFSKRNVAASD